jgi:hypothetical protein
LALLRVHFFILGAFTEDATDAEIAAFVVTARARLVAAGLPGGAIVVGETQDYATPQDNDTGEPRLLKMKLVKSAGRRTV